MTRRRRPCIRPGDANPRHLPKIVNFLGYDPAPEEQATSLPDRIRAKRRRFGLSRKRLAAMLETCPSNLAGWETGRHRPTRKSIELINRFLLSGKRRCDEIQMSSSQCAVWRSSRLHEKHSGLRGDLKLRSPLFGRKLSPVRIPISLSSRPWPNRRENGSFAHLSSQGCLTTVLTGPRLAIGVIKALEWRGSG